MCEDGDFRCIRTGCTAWVDSNDCEDDEDEDEHAERRALFDGEVPPEAPTLQIDVDALLADFASTVDVDMDYMEGFERFA